MLFFPVLSYKFYILYILCGFSDMMDGTIARKTESISEFGTQFDTIADFIFLSVSFIKFLPLIHIPKWLCIWIIVIAIIKTGNIICGYICKKQFISLHTILNKVTGLLLFLLPLTFSFIELKYSFISVCSIATISAIQETAIVNKKH